jgi:hypothetical protein
MWAARIDTDQVSLDRNRRKQAQLRQPRHRNESSLVLTAIEAEKVPFRLTFHFDQRAVFLPSNLNLASKHLTLVKISGSSRVSSFQVFHGETALSYKTILMSLNNLQRNQDLRESAAGAGRGQIVCDALTIERCGLQAPPIGAVEHVRVKGRGRAIDIQRIVDADAEPIGRSA